ncbi:MAG: hypothetical protein FOGNACKC_06250 [Anaerolineae bacterium]|nr:hypothetical protein [Anaerolineae bacterium]
MKIIMMITAPGVNTYLKTRLVFALFFLLFTPLLFLTRVPILNVVSAAPPLNFPANNSLTVDGELIQENISKQAASEASWTQVGFSGQMVSQIAINPANPKVIYVGSSTVGFGVYKTTDGGISWTQIKSGLPGNVAVASLVVDPQNSDVLYIGTYTVGTSLYGGVYKSINGGTSWSRILVRTNKSNFRSVAVDPRDSNVIYAIDSYQYTNHVFKSVDSGNTWSVKDNGMTGFDPFKIVIDPADNKTLYLLSGRDGIFKSVNGGTSWTAINNGLGTTYTQAFAIDPTNNQIIYTGVGRTGGVYKSTNGGGSWSLMASGLNSAQVSALLLDPTNPQTLYAATTLSGGATGAGIYQTSDGALSWTPINEGFPQDISSLFVNSVAIDPGIPKFVFASSTNGLWSRMVSAPSRSPIVLVHGFQGLDITPLNCAPETASTDVIKYSGLNSSYAIQYWRNMPAWLLATGKYDVWIAQLTTGREQGTPSLTKNANCLREQIKYISALYDEPITVIAHSMGGVVARACLSVSDCGNKVSNIYTLGSPHAGLPAASYYQRLLDLRCDKNEKFMAVCQMSETYMRQYYNSMVRNQSGIKYHFLGGDLSPTTPDVYQRFKGIGPHDGLVGSFSAVGWESNGEFYGDWQIDSAPQQLWTDEVHSVSFSESDTVGQYRNDYYQLRVFHPDIGQKSYAFQCVYALMNEQTLPDFCRTASMVSQTMTSQDSSDPAQMTALHSGSIYPSQVITTPFLIDDNNSATFDLIWDTGLLTFNLVRPDGQVIDQDYATNHPTEVAFDFTQGDPGVTSLASFRFDSGAVSGVWELQVSANSTNAAVTRFQTFAQITNDRSLVVETNKSNFNVGETAVITTTMTNNSQNIPGVTIEATFSRPDGVTDMLLLTEAENGIYETTYTIPDTPGFLAVDVNAIGNDAGMAFTRHSNLILAVAPHDVQLTGLYNELPRDDDGNGLYESLDLSFEVNATETKDYFISADLVIGNQLVAHTGIYTSLTAGNQIITVPFDGNEIRASRMSGPYTASRLNVVPMDLGIASNSVNDVIVTQAYDWFEFGQSVLTITTTSPLSYGHVGEVYSTTLQAVGGVIPYQWSVISGTFPSGLTLNPTTGMISGTPSLANVYTFTVECTSSDVQTATKAFSITVEELTTISLLSFGAVQDSKGVTVTWETGTEIDTAGFNLYRSVAEDGPYSKINLTIIPAKGDVTSGDVYFFLDADASDLDTLYFYKLEEIDINGISTFYGPVNTASGVSGNPNKGIIYLPIILKESGF